MTTSLLPTLDVALPLRWTDLPDPRHPDAPRGAVCELEIPLKRWRHLVTRHVAQQSEPWGELLGEAERAALLASFEPPQPAAPRSLEATVARQAPAASGDGRSLLRRAADKLEDAVRDSLRRPLVLLFVQIVGRHERSQWVAILRCGAVVPIDAHDRPTLKTAYFPSELCGADGRSRSSGRPAWQVAARRMVMRYCSLRADGGHVAPDPEWVVRRQDETGGHVTLARKFQFVSAEAWGFRTEQGGLVWRGARSAWRPQDATEEQTAVRGPMNACRRTQGGRDDE